MLQYQRNMTKLLGFLLLILTASCCEEGGKNLGFKTNRAQIAVGYATCVNIQTDFKSQISNWTYAPCKKIQSKNNVKDIELIVQEKSHLLALSLYDKKQNVNVFSFRATVCGQDNANFKIDANIALEDYEEWGLEGAKAHSGFYNSYLKLQSQVRQNAQNLIKANPKAKFYVTGISLGAALAAFAAFDLANYFQEKGIQVDWAFYTFGQPRIGNKNFINAVNNKITIYRVVNQDDPVPHMPSRQGLVSALPNIYYNTGIQVYLPTNQPNTAHICAGDSTYCSLNKNFFTIQSACRHIGYPDLVFKNINTFSVKQNCPYGNKIQFKSQKEQRKLVFDFLRQCCKVVCKEIKQPSCFDSYPPELQCKNTLPVEDQLIQKILFYSHRKISQKKDTTTTAKEYACKEICPKLESAKNVPSAQDLKELQEEGYTQL